MLIPLGVSLYYGDGDAPWLAVSMILTLVSGSGLVLAGHKNREISLRDGFAVVGFGWLAMALAGALPFYLEGSIPSFTDAFFESMSGFTTTGASILGPHLPIESLPHGLLFWRSLTHWIGGMGIILLSLAILPMLSVGGMQLYRAEVPGPTKDKITPRLRDTAEILWLVYLSISIVEIALLWAGGMNLFDAACHTFGTMATGGFSTRTDSIAAFNSRYIEYVIIIFMFIAGTNFALHYRLFKGSLKEYWASREFRLFLSLIGMFTLIIAVINLVGKHTGGFEETVRTTLFQVVSIITTTGYGSADWELWGPLAQILLVLLMVCGSMAGSTGGGVKVIRVQILFKHIQIELRRLIHPQAIMPLRLGGKRIDDGIVRNVCTLLLVYCLILIFSTAILAGFGIDLVTSFGASIASLSNIGPGLGDVGAADNYHWMHPAVKWLLAGLMMLGRLEIFTVLVLFNRHFWRK